MGMKLGDSVRERCEAEVCEIPNITSIVKVKVKLHIKDPINPRMYIWSKTNGVTWIDFKYEKLTMFCFKYG